MVTSTLKCFCNACALLLGCVQILLRLGYREKLFQLYHWIIALLVNLGKREHDEAQQETSNARNYWRARPERCGPEDAASKNDWPHNGQIDEVQGVEHGWY